MDLFGLVYHVLALLILALGIFVIYDEHKKKVNIAFFFYALGAFGWMLSLYWGYFFADVLEYSMALAVFRYAYAFSIFAMSMMTIFLYLFPRVTFKVNRFLAYLFYAVTIILVVFSIFSPFIHQGLVIEYGQYTGDILGILYPLYSFHILANLILSVFFAFHTYRHVEGIEKNKVAHAILGYLAFVTLAIVTNVILPIYDIFIIQRQVPLLSLLFIIPAFVSMYRYRFFNLSYFSFNVLRKIILYGAFLLIGILLMNLFEIRESIDLARHSVAILITLFIYEWTQRYIPHFFVGNLKEMMKVVDEFSSKIYYADNYEKIKAVLDEIFILKLHFVRADLFVVRKNEKGIRVPVHPVDDFTKRLAQLRRNILVRGEISYMRLPSRTQKVLMKEMNKQNAHLCIPLYSEDNLIGLLFLEHKEEHYNFSKEILNELLSVKKPLEIALMNLLLKLNLEEENNLMKAIIEKKTRQLKKKIDEINELLKQQADFIAVTAHEFRTPLSIATFQVDDILNSKKPAKQRLADLKVVESSIANIKVLTEKLFAVQQYDLNKVEIHPEKIDLTAFIRQLHKDFQPIMKNKGLKFSLKNASKKKLYIKVDQAQFRQVLHNLLTNASKFTPKGGKIELYLGARKGEVDVRVTDNGDGIPDDLKKSIFEKFRTKKAGAGIGLGLYLCKKIIELHKGKLWVEDAPGGGASFRMTLKAVR